MTGGERHARVRSDLAVTDWKPVRVVDADAYGWLHRTYRVCLVCGSYKVSAAHVVGKGAGGDTVRGNLIPLCGGGSSGCHGAYDNGHAHVSDTGLRVESRHVKAAVARFLRSDEGEVQASYLIWKRGPFGAEAFVQKLEQAD